MATPEFIYFDLGNVLLTFDNQRACAQMSRVSGLPEGQLRDLFGEHDFQNQLERGETSFASVVESLGEFAGRSLDVAAMRHAYADIFDLVPGIVPVVARLAAANVRLGVLSNTSDPHWELITDGRFAILPAYFGTFALSFEIGAMKPDERIYEQAAKLANVAPSQIFFTDDRAENVEAASRAGWDAVLFESPGQVAEALTHRGVKFNY